MHAFLGRTLGLDLAGVDSLLNKKSGMLGLCGVTDFRDINDLINEGDKAADLAMDVYVHRLVSYIGSYLAVLGGVDVLTFTAGVGENDALVRARVLDRLAPLGFLMDAEANGSRSREPRVISTAGLPGDHHGRPHQRGTRHGTGDQGSHRLTLLVAGPDDAPVIHRCCPQWG